MQSTRWLVPFACAGIAWALIPFGTAHAADCGALAAVALPHTTITSAVTVAAGAFVPPAPAGGAPARGATASPFRALPAFCRVSATSKPTADSDIRFEVWLPLAHWNGKFQGVGNGGLGGVISYVVCETE